jgi:cytochrome P450
MGTPSAFDSFGPETAECPFELYATLRREAPVRRLPGQDYWVVSRMEDIREVALHPEVFSSNIVAIVTGATPEVHAVRSRGVGLVDVLATADPPVHSRQRRLANGAFNVRRITEREPAIRALAEALVDGFVGARRVELMSAFAVPLPLTVIADFLGLPRADLSRLKRWSDHGVAALSGLATPAELVEHAEGMMEMSRYLARRVEAALAAPGDGFLADLVRASGESEEHLSSDEVVAILSQLVIAGTESTASLIGSAVWLLAGRPSLAAELRAAPQRIPAFVEETLRLESPFQGHFRVVLQDTELGGISIPRGARLMVCWGSANRDEDVFASPETVDLGRPNPKEHVAFGEGIHYCLGAPLARLEARVALETLLARLPDLRLAPGFTPRHVPSFFIRRLAALDLELQRA